MKKIAKEIPDFFNPPLSAKRCEALERTQSELMNKVILKFDKPFWDNNKQLIFIKSKHRQTGMREWLNLCHYSPNDPILIAHYVGSEAQFDEKTDAEIVEEAMLELREVYGNNIPEPSTSFVTHWDKDPFSLGSWMTPNNNAQLMDIFNIGEAAGALYFAGEHLAFYGGNVHGAFVSGKQVAEDLMTNLLNLPNESKPNMG